MNIVDSLRGTSIPLLLLSAKGNCCGFRESFDSLCKDKHTVIRAALSEHQMINSKYPYRTSELSNMYLM